jgi:uncharacterized protein YxeA
MPVNKKPQTKANNSKSPIKKNLSKSYSKKNTNNNSIYLIIGIIISILILVIGLFFIFNKSKDNSKANKTIYIKADKKPEKLKVESYTDSEKKEKVIKETFKHSSKEANTDKPAENKQNLTSTNYPNKFLSPAREWQPINPGLRVATNGCNNLVYGGYPKTNLILTILENTSYYTAYSELKRNPIWVAYRLDSFKGKNSLQRLTKFVPDLRTKSKINQKVYSKTGYDKGHMCPNSLCEKRTGRNFFNV